MGTAMSQPAVAEFQPPLAIASEERCYKYDAYGLCAGGRAPGVGMDSTPLYEAFPIFNFSPWSAK